MEIDVIVCADALEYTRSLPDQSVHCIVTSPPYDDLRRYGGEWSFPFEAIAHEAYRVLVPGGVMVWVVGDSVKNGSETLNSMRQALFFVDVVGFRMHDTMIYVKDGLPFPDVSRYYQAWEYMFVLSKDAPKTINLLTQGRSEKSNGQGATFRQEDGTTKRIQTNAINAARVMENVWMISSGYMRTTNDKEAYTHPAMFPEELARRHILTWTNPGDVVLDFFAGSGTTLKMARNLDRHYIGCDINPEYVKLATERLAQSDPFQHTVLPDGSKQLSLFASKGDD